MHKHICNQIPGQRRCWVAAKLIRWCLIKLSGGNFVFFKSCLNFSWVLSVFLLEEILSLSNVMFNSRHKFNGHNFNVYKQCMIVIFQYKQLMGVGTRQDQIYHDESMTLARRISLKNRVVTIMKLSTCLWEIAYSHKWKMRTMPS